MTNSRIITINGQKVGIVGLDEALADLGADWADRDEQAVGQELLGLLSSRNYIPSSARQAYALALGREYRRSLGLPVPEQGGGLEIKVLGPGCSRCESLNSSVIKVLSELGLAADVEHVRDMATIASHGVMGTPALVINGKVVSVGTVPTPRQIKDWIAAASR